MRNIKHLPFNPLRKNLSRRKEVISPPDLLHVQKKSFEDFVQFNKNPYKRENKGLENIFRTSFPFEDPNGQIEIRYIAYEIGDWECGKCRKPLPEDVVGGPEIPCPNCGGVLIYKEKNSIEECKYKGLTYSAPLRVLLELIVNHVDPSTGEITPKTIKRHKVYFGDIPLLTDKAYFIINGSERVVVSQLIRSSGIFFEAKEDKTKDILTRIIYKGSIIPEKGSRLEFEHATNVEIFNARIDRRKLLGTTILRAFGLDSAYKILKAFYSDVKRYVKKDNEYIDEKTGVVYNIDELVKELENDEIFITYTVEEQDEKGNAVTIRHEKAVEPQNLEKYLLDDRLTIEEIVAISPLVFRKSPYGNIIIETLKKDEPQINAMFTFQDAARVDIYRKMRPTDTAVMDPKAFLKRANELFNSVFYDHQRYDLSKVGRVKINAKVHDIPKTIKPLDLDTLLEKYPPLALGEDVEIEGETLKAGTKIDQSVIEKLKTLKFEEIKVEQYLDDEARFILLPDVIAIVKYLLEIRLGKKELDDIAHLGNRRVRPVGELLENQARLGLVRMNKAFRDRVATVDIEDPNLKAADIVNPRYVTGSILEFLKGGQLSQFMDQANPLAELTHKRRLSALGPGGLTRDSAKFEIRDVHPTHYGRVCPIETPEGQNIGLISSMTVYSTINEFGFLVSPYRKVKNGKVTNEIEYLAAYDEEKYVIAQANAPVDDEGNFLAERVLARAKGDIRLVDPKEVDYMDVSPKQVVSVSASLIPFLEHDDANRALMGSNMQRQAVPLLKTEYPLVGTGMEKIVAKNSGAAVVAKRGGVVESVSGNRIVIKVNPEEINQDDPLDIGLDVYELMKFKGSNQATCMNQRPLVRRGDKVEAGAIIADGTSTYRGELALGKNVLVAFMPWRGYNFEDAIVISERLVKDDVFTSIHIEEFECEARETKLGSEEITRNIVGVSEKALANLDEHGIVRVGAYVKPGDILVGKVTPKGETQPTPEEKLLLAIFGEKASEVKDSSLRVPAGVEGIVIDVQVFARKKTGKKEDRYLKQLAEEEINRLEKELEEKKRFIQARRDELVKELIIGQKVPRDIKVAGKVVVKKGEEITEKTVDAILRFIVVNPSGFLSDKKVAEDVEKIVSKAKLQIELWENIYEKQKAAVQKGSDLKPGVNELVKVYIAQKRKIQVGDKMAGRHGNKGVISVVLPEEDMPFMEDGTPVDIVLNPLGVPSRMNVGQILETHLGLAAKKLGQKLYEELKKLNSKEALIDKIIEYYEIANDTAGELAQKYREEDIRELRRYLESLDDETLKAIIKDLGEIGIPVRTPVFEGATEEDIKTMLRKAGFKETGKMKLIDGRTGEPFDLEVTAGYMYMLKLIHMVDDKIHARSTGPYSLITQQPLGGRAQFGGQRFGEMEVWALEAHGAAYTLQEMLTVKSDDIEGRKRVYESIVKGRYYYDIGVPESFKVLVRELKALALDVQCNMEGGEKQACDQVDIVSKSKKKEL
ncbi:DNA-directed RNA polymerase, beta subunit [Persephonella marina EX-H1]|uniref:DNA-directed RNA polymerase subunit beta n=1 Tax=Persephonella marina (strain DSM 14350 / EX-H1) TaxID=123214 RepID=C0QQL6_PERMH|nr:DNA-directed RNA polymerase subunit beta [Persephonella marina]ACO03861.1 DNA-directed RNA polymerase, beta subunit [Persephonella marina EX-H1]